MKLTTKVLLRSSLTCSLLILKFLLSPTSYAAERVLWRETFEGEADLWSADRGSWQFGPPTNPSGPDAIEGERCASVGLRGNHPNGLRTSFIRDEYFTVPPAEQNPRLRFYHWFSTFIGDFGQVRIRELGGEPESISETYSAVSRWSKASLPLSKYSGKKIRVEFYFESNSDNLNSAGWFIDDIALVVGHSEFSGFESFEGPNLWSFHDWHPTRGNWEIGTPTHGPGRAYRGTNCAAVRLSANHPNFVSSALCSPFFTVPSAEQNPQLRFHHWFSTFGGDYGRVQIREEGGESIVISENYEGVSDWARAILSLTNFATKRVRIEFLYASNSDNLNSSGWFIDDVQISTGDYQFRGFEGFESGASDWAPTRGNWQIGTPTIGPNAAFSGTNCAALRLSAAHPNLVNSSLLSPPFLVPPVEQNPRLRFQHWFSTYGGDFGEVRIRDDSGLVTTNSEAFTGVSDWTRATISLSSFAGKIVRIEFYFRSNSDNLNSSGWFIDDIELLASPQQNWPVLQAIGTQIAPKAGPITFTARATDLDVGQSLIYSIDATTAPEGASINPQTGVFSWDPTLAQRGTNAWFIRFRATDSGTPPRSTSELVPVIMPAGIRIQHSHVWEPFHLQVLGAVPGLNYTAFGVTNILGNALFPDSSPPSLTNFVIGARGEASYFTDSDPARFKVFIVKGELPAQTPAP